MMYKRTIFFALLFLFGCNLDEKELIGHWQASHFYESGQSVSVSLNDVYLDILENNRYFFKGAYQYTEAGHFSSSMHFLFLNDTTAKEPKEKILKVLYLSSDSLKIRMENAGKEQVLFFAKEKK
jgi:hypothetical protein